MPKFLLLLFSALFLLGCEEDKTTVLRETPETPKPEVNNLAQPEVKYEAASVSESQKDALVKGSNDFAFDLYKCFADPSKSVFFSPYSVSSAMGMLTLGARGETENELKKVLRFQDGGAQLGSEFKELRESIVSSNEKFTMTDANSLWLNVGFKMLESYGNAVKEFFGGQAETINFADNKAAAKKINSWIEDHTRKLIKDMIQPDALGPSTRLVLVNAVSFLAKWQVEFEEGGTRSLNCQDCQGRTAKADLMRQESYLSVADLEGVKAVELDYLGAKYSFLALMPDDPAAFPTFVKGLDSGVVEKYTKALASEDVILLFPKFDTEYSQSLTDIFKKMGLSLSFTDSADFSGISKEGLCVSDVIHKAKIKVYESGTEAAAATAVMVKCTGIAMKRPKEFRFNKPFVYMIREKATGAILFMGHYTVQGK